MEIRNNVLAKASSEKNKQAKIFINPDRSKEEREYFNTKLAEKRSLIENDKSGEVSK